MKEEHILCAAIWYTDLYICDERPKNIDKGFVLSGRRHHNIITTLYQLTKHKTLSNKVHIQGFLTSHNRFVDRYEGRKVAFRAGQVKSDNGCLFSEDLY